MTEKEIFINMIKRVSGDERGGSFWKENEENKNSVTVYNDSNIETVFEFNEAGKLIWFR